MKSVWIALVLLAPTAHAAVDYSVCPDVTKIATGFYDPKLTLEDVMYQFRDQMNDADAVVDDGESGTAVTDAQMAGAADDVEAARNCALLVVRNAGHTMTPESVSDLPADQQGPKLGEFVAAMNQLADLFGQYRDLFSGRDFAALKSKSSDIRDFEAQEHDKF